MSYLDTQNAGHDLAKVTKALTEIIGKTDFSRPLAVEECHELYRASATVEARTDVLKLALGPDYREAQPLRILGHVPVRGHLSADCAKVAFKVGARVTSLTGHMSGTVSEDLPDADSVMVRWDGADKAMPTLVARLVAAEPAKVA